MDTKRGVLSDKAAKLEIAKDATELLKSSASKRTQLLNLRVLIRANKAATGLQFHSGDLAKLLVRAENEVKSGLSARERGIADLKDYLVIA
jgi:hypothetical protein